MTFDFFLERVRSVANYYLEFFSSAIKETPAPFGGWWQFLILPVALFIGSFLLLLWAGDKPWQNLKATAAALAITVLLVMFLFVVNLFMTPVRLADQESKRCAEEKELLLKTIKEHKKRIADLESEKQSRRQDLLTLIDKVIAEQEGNLSLRKTTDTWTDPQVVRQVRAQHLHRLSELDASIFHEGLEKVITEVLRYSEELHRLNVNTDGGVIQKVFIHEFSPCAAKLVNLLKEMKGTIG